jgi:pyrimidine-nucleoside phosphorylase
LNPELFEKAKYEYVVKAPIDGFISSVDTEGYGIASLLLGAGRNVKEDVIDFSAGIILSAKVGDYVKKGDLIATLYTSSEDKFTASAKKLLESTHITQTKPEKRPLILARVE